MSGVVTATIQGHTGSINYTATFTAACADVAGAQTLLNGVKSFLAGGSTIDNVNATFMPTSTSLS